MVINDRFIIVSCYICLCIGLLRDCYLENKHPKSIKNILRNCEETVVFKKKLFIYRDKKKHQKGYYIVHLFINTFLSFTTMTFVGFQIVTPLFFHLTCIIFKMFYRIIQMDNNKY